MSTTHEAWTGDAWARADELGLDPCSRSGGEARIRCPNGCDAEHRRHDYGASLNVSTGDRCGLWICHRCGEGGSVAAGITRDWTPDPSRQRPAERPLPDPVDAAAAWAALQEVRYRHAGSIRRWALDRGWPVELADAVAESRDVAWAPSQPIGHTDADRVAEHARRAERPLLVALRDADGVVVSVMRRRAAPGQEPKAMQCWRGVCCPAPGTALIYGDVGAWASSVQAGGLGLIVEGEPDYLAAAAMIATGQAGPATAAIGCPAAGGLWGLAEAAGRALVGAMAMRGRVVLVPHLGDKGSTEAQKDKGERAMGAAGGCLRKLASSTLVSTLHLRPLTRGKVDLAEVLERCGAAALAGQIAEVAPRIVTDGEASWVWSDDMREEGAEATRTLARRCWPVALTRRVEAGEHGLRYRYVSRQGAVGYGVLPASAWADMSAAQTAAREAADAGVEILPRQGAAWALALGQWASRTYDAQTVAVVRRPGWHADASGPVYVHGTGVHGADWIYDGPEVRTHRAGTLASWRAGVDGLVNSAGLLLALGCSLAGAMVGPLGMPLFVVHLAGRSSSGKTSAGRLAASVWARPGDVVPYNGTMLGLSLTAESRNGACVALDEIKESDPTTVGRLIHTLTDGRSRTMARRDGEDTREVREWSLTGVSTGEVTIAEYLGRSAQGGHAVRAIDLRIALGEVTTDGAHAVELARWLDTSHGVAGEAWTGHLQTLANERWIEIGAAVDAMVARAMPDTAQADPDPELGRICRSLALCCLALVEGTAAGIVGIGVDTEGADRLLAWALARVSTERGLVTSPEARALQSLRELYESSPDRWPDEQTYRSGKARDVIGVRITEPDGGYPPRPVASGTVAVTEGTLKASGICVGAGVGPRQLLAWLHEQGLSDGGSKSRVGDVQARWHRLRLSEVE